MCCCALCRLTVTDVFDLIGLMVRGKAVSHLLPSHVPQEQRPSRQEQQQQQQQPSPQQQQGGEALAGKQHEQAAGMMTQQSAGRRNMSWSEVTYVMS
jgi:hypothetical protein